jgi:hypothetical protein
MLATLQLKQSNITTKTTSRKNGHERVRREEELRAIG